MRCNSDLSSTPRLPPTALVVHSYKRTAAIGQRKLCILCFFRWSMVTGKFKTTPLTCEIHRARGHPRFGTNLTKVDTIILVFRTPDTTRYLLIIMTRLICTGTLTRSRSLTSPCCKAVKGVSRKHTGNLFFYCLLTEAERTLNQAGIPKS